ncbi:MAG: hypothetical protein K2Q28_08490 [Hyphomicrobium sp.]|nr:hypothetical protein [Hyphomicrobium sp.]
MGQLSGSGAVFLSASVPDNSSENFVGEGDSAAIAAAVSGLLYVTLGRRKLVWGGHPAITPMVWAFCESMEVDYGAWVKLFQSDLFEDDFPEENAFFKNVTLTKRSPLGLEKSLEIMREQMISETALEAAVFIGGMKGVLVEYKMIREYAPSIKILPLATTGGAASLIALQGEFPTKFSREMDYVALFHEELEVDFDERRYRSPSAQPKNVVQRLENPRQNKKPK